MVSRQEAGGGELLKLLNYLIWVSYKVKRRIFLLSTRQSQLGKEDMFITGKKRRWPVLDPSASTEGQRTATEDETKVKEPFTPSFSSFQGWVNIAGGEQGKGAAEVAPHQGRDWGRWRGSVLTGGGWEKRNDRGHTAPAPPAAAGWGRAGQQSGLRGWGGVGCGGEGLGGLAAPSAQSMTFQRPAPRLGPEAPSQPTRRQPVAAGSLGSPPHLRESCEARQAHLSARRPRPVSRAVRLAPQLSAALGPRSLPGFARSPLSPAPGGEGSGCVGPGAGVLGELTGLGGLGSSPFPSAAGSGGDARAPPLL